MSTDRTAQNIGVGAVYVAISAGTNIAVALRRSLTEIKYANVKYGEEHYKDYLKKRGHEFKKDINMARVAMDVKKSDIERQCVTKEDVAIIKAYSKKYGLDFNLARKPKDLDQLIERKYIKGEKLNRQEEKIVTAFTYRDKDGKPVMDPENPKKPLVNDAEYMLTFATVDLSRWELICREMEARSHVPSFEQRMRNAQQWTKVHTVHLQNKAKELLKNREGKTK
ncbi:hypothetical protein [Faecalicoccus acidiformans]|uniref:Uncharacterized protein n=1 Tax=Faecalicoccus acidiformans TaxID=915173 RepID=A0ABS2FM27_9FIRM|nr:hypothetical protein [Faecalicoccus acidiformans]MBM6830977.1 hypothetical protein [Faecalicoccus acidiformans]